MKNRIAQIVIVIVSCMLWASVLVSSLIAIVVQDLDLVRVMVTASRTSMEVLFVWSALVAISSRGGYRFSVGITVSLALILILKQAFPLDAPDQLARWIQGVLPEMKTANEASANLTALRNGLIYQSSVLTCCALGGIVALLMGDMSTEVESYQSSDRNPQSNRERRLVPQFRLKPRGSRRR
jgi:hypothetical protein